MGILQVRTDMEVKDWIIYYREAWGRFTYTDGTPKKWEHFKPDETVAKVFHGTEEEAAAEAKRVELAHGITGPFSNHYSYVQ